MINRRETLTLVYNEREEKPLTWREICKQCVLRLWYGAIALVVIGIVFGFIILSTFLLIGFITLP